MEKRIIAETGRANTVLPPSVCYLVWCKSGAEDIEQALNVRMRLSGAEVHGVEAGAKPLKRPLMKP